MTPAERHLAESLKYSSQHIAHIISLPNLGPDIVALFDVTRRHLLYLGPLQSPAFAQAFHARPQPSKSPAPKSRAEKSAQVAALLGPT